MRSTCEQCGKKASSSSMRSIVVQTQDKYICNFLALCPSCKKKKEVAKAKKGTTKKRQDINTELHLLRITIQIREHMRRNPLVSISTGDVSYNVRRFFEETYHRPLSELIARQCFLDEKRDRLRHEVMLGRVLKPANGSYYDRAKFSKQECENSSRKLKEIANQKKRGKKELEYEKKRDKRNERKQAGKRKAFELSKKKAAQMKYEDDLAFYSGVTTEPTYGKGKKK